jgi:hypothetical protein|tara:strand:- start:118 stop:321 length:204 start_codon:yes stop_codon:yes gene_type:complete
MLLAKLRLARTLGVHRKNEPLLFAVWSNADQRRRFAQRVVAIDWKKLRQRRYQRASPDVLHCLEAYR